jgi:DNA repair protein RecN (Recombination protein N)
MLTHIFIKDLALVETLEINFSRCFNVITGETGAGKSILIKALSLALGHRGQVDDIRTGCDQAVVVAEFQIPSGHMAWQHLSHLGLADAVAANQGNLLVRRQLPRKSRSQAWINDTPITLTSLKELGYYLVDVSSQHENQRILNPKEHKRYLDQFLPDQEILARVASAYRDCQVQLDELKSYLASYYKLIHEIDYWRFRQEEIAILEPSAEDFADLTQQVAGQQDRLKAHEAAGQALALIDGEDGESGVFAGLARAKDYLNRSGYEALLAHGAALGDLSQQLEEISFGLNRFVGQNQEGQAELEAAQERLALYKAMMRKLRMSSIDEIVAEAEQIGAKIAFVEGAPEALVEKVLELKQGTETLVTMAAMLSTARQQAADEVSQKVNRELADLHMPGAQLVVELKPRQLFGAEEQVPELPSQCDPTLRQAWTHSLNCLQRLSPQGAESVKFLFIGNLGEEARPLQQVASGGEISRIMLALKKALAAGAETCLLVFDEIDTGISGMVADLVGRKLAALAQNFQVICVSHLPQVAAYADQHLLVQKSTAEGRTQSQIKPIHGRQRAQEIARLLSAEAVTSASLNNARSLLKRAENLGRMEIGAI